MCHFLMECIRDLESRIESRIISSFDLESCRDVIYETNSILNLDGSIPIGLKQCIGFIFIEIWIEFKARLNDIVQTGEVRINSLYDAFFNSISRGINIALHKYRHAFDLCTEVYIAKFISYIDMYFNDHNIGSDKKCILPLKKAVIAAFKTLLDIKLSLASRFKLAIELLLLGVIESVQCISKSYVNLYLNNCPEVCSLANQICDIIFEKISDVIKDGRLFEIDI